MIAVSRATADYIPSLKIQTDVTSIEMVEAAKAFNISFSLLKLNHAVNGRINIECDSVLAGLQLGTRAKNAGCTEVIVELGLCMNALVIKSTVDNCCAAWQYAGQNNLTATANVKILTARLAGIIVPKQIDDMVAALGGLPGPQFVADAIKASGRRLRARYGNNVSSCPELTGINAQVRGAIVIAAT